MIGTDITERKQAEEALREGEERFRALVETTSDWIWEVDQNGVYSYVSPKIKELLGYEPEEMIGRTPFDYMPPDEAKRIARIFEDIVKSQKPFATLENVNLHKDGRRVVLETSGVPRFDVDGNLVGYRGIDRDITERKKAEEVLRESEERYRELINTSVDGVISIDTEMRIILWNPGAERIFGYTKEEMQGQSLMRIVPKSFREAMEKGFVEFRKSGSGPVIGKTLELEGVRKDGIEIAVELSVSSRRVDETYIATAIVRDITERKQAEEEIRKLNSAVDQSIDGIAIGDLEPKLTYVNEAYARMHGYSAKALIGKKVTILHNKEQMEDFKKRIHIIKTKGSWEGEIGHIRKDGTPFPTQMSVTLLKDENGKPTGILAVCRDITERKQAEEALRESEEKHRKLFEETSDAIFVADAKTAILTACNRAALELVGRDRSEVVGKHQRILHPPQEINGEFSRTYKQHLREKEGQVLEAQVITKKGEIKDVAIRASRVELKGRSWIQGMFRDITERKQMEAELTRSHKKLRELSVHLLHLRENERKSFAHAIHDDLGQLLTVLKMDLSRLYEKLPPSQKTLQGMTKSLIEQAEKTMEVVQRISTELRPKLLDDIGLIPAIKWQVKEFQNRTGIKCKLNIIPQHIHLDNDLDTTIFRILQEGLTNVARHANAIRVEVNLKENNGKLMLKIRDNGKGITKKQISDPKSFGLMGIQERVFSWEGKLDIKGIKDKGTTITIRLPLEKKMKSPN